MSTVKLHSNPSSNSNFNFANDADVVQATQYEPSSPESPCSVFGVFNTDDFRLGPYDFQDSRTKMSCGASPSSALPKKKKKADGKGQSQLNKCLNEKRRRELENIYIEELAEIISASFADMSSLSVKPDKCAILQETVKKVRDRTHRISSDQTVNLITTESAVQQGEVSSSKPTTISNPRFTPLLLSVLDGFLFVVNTDGKIQFVSDNVEQFLHFTTAEFIHQSIYTFIHEGDCTKFGVFLNKQLLNYSSSANSPGSNQPTTSHMEQSPSGSTNFNCRLLIKEPSDLTGEEKPNREKQNETFQIWFTNIDGGMVEESSTTESQTSQSSQSLLCIARRVPLNEKHLSPPLEQFTIKLDKEGKILALDTKDVSNNYAQYINEKNLVGRFLHNKCHKTDVHKVIKHLQETHQAGFSTSPVYQLHLTEDKFVNVQTKSKFFKSNDGSTMDFIMAAHFIVGDSEMCAMIENNSNISRMMTDTLSSSLNGSDGLISHNIGPNQPVTSLQSESKFSNSDYNTTPSSDLNISEFELFPSTTFGDILHENNKWPEQSTNFIETPSRTTPVQSPAHISSNPHTPAAQTQYNFQFSPLMTSPKDSFDSNSSIDRMESARLRALLLTKHPDRREYSEENNITKNNHNILKGLLNPDDMTCPSPDVETANPSTPSSPANIQASQNNSHLNDISTANTSHNNNNMLLKLLNDKSQHEDKSINQSGIKNENEFLEELLKEENIISQHTNMLEQNEHSNENLIFKSMGLRLLPQTSPEMHNRKRNSLSGDDENDQPPLKRSSGNLGPSVLDSISSPSGPQVSQVTNSKLRERNKMLASLLAENPTPTAIPSIPASVISATPQDKLGSIIKQHPPAGHNWNSGGPPMHISQNMQQNQPKGQQRASLQKSGNNNLYLNHILDQQSQQGQSQMQIQQIRHVTSSANNNFGTQLSTVAESSNSNSSLPFHSDPELSELLEEVMDIMDGPSVTDNSTLLNLFNPIEMTSASNVGGTTNQTSFIMNEKMAVNAIQKSLMQVESTVKSPLPLNYGSPTGSNLHTSNQYVLSPAYQSQQKPSARFNPQQSPGLITGVTPYSKNLQSPPLQQVLLQHKQKQRLLQQQQNQKIMVVTTNAGSSTPNPTAALQTIDSLLNNTGPPNVALQRSSSLPDSQSQLSPVYAPSGSQLLNSSQISPCPSNRQSYSTIPQQSFSMLNYGTSTLTPSTPQQQIIQSPSRISSSIHPQYKNPCVASQQQQTQQSIYINPTQQSGTGAWAQQRLTLHQRQNPMLNAQLQIPGFDNNSVRQNCMNQQPGCALTSPVSYNSEVPSNNNCQQFRLPRNIGMTNSNSQVSGANNGVTEFTRNELRAFVGVRSQQQGNTRLSSQLPGQNITELDPLGLNFDMSPTGSNENPKWSNMNSDLGSPSPQSHGIIPPTRNPVEEFSRTNNANSTNNVGVSEQKSLLQKLLSE
ncbi:Myc-type, basic helix-loop-helix (bHLH) domain,PAS fold,PAS domain [Cinara cedri]|uniref:Myc-type, basic helix-loop-helix (BHLH) domain,PAS fold,PAS domain n=1 Tax=Cinara cedri TaxID=506608 RepID=A0A5E4MWG8_9HEMI|nr:Myc-type, basic helix-loop-helix (bHLH) domain,PAS fold,PAS domain [Cinara cedri]